VLPASNYIKFLLTNNQYLLEQFPYLNTSRLLLNRITRFNFDFRLKPLDIEFMKQLHNKVNIVPVIAKADVLTRGEVQKLKAKIMQEIAANGIKVYPLPDCDSDEDEDYKEQVLIIRF